MVWAAGSGVGHMRRTACVRLSLVVAMVVLVSCGGSQVASPARTDPTIARATTTTDPFDPPAVIDEAYINRVLAELARIEGDAVRDLVATRSFSPEFLAVIRSLYLDEFFFEGKIEDLASEFADDFIGFRPVPGDRSVRVTEIISARPDCIFVEVLRDSSPLAGKVIPTTINWIALVRVPAERDLARRNSTGWGYEFYGFLEGHVAPPDPCQR